MLARILRSLGFLLLTVLMVLLAAQQFEALFVIFAVFAALGAQTMWTPILIRYCCLQLAKLEDGQVRTVGFVVTAVCGALMLLIAIVAF